MEDSSLGFVQSVSSTIAALLSQVHKHVRSPSAYTEGTYI